MSCQTVVLNDYFYKNTKNFIKIRKILETIPPKRGIHSYHDRLLDECSF